jgi:hypothetical protein
MRWENNRYMPGRSMQRPWSKSEIPSIVKALSVSAACIPVLFIFNIKPPHEHPALLEKWNGLNIGRFERE